MEGNYEGNYGRPGYVLWTVRSTPRRFPRASMVKTAPNDGQWHVQPSTRTGNRSLEGTYGRNGNYGRQPTGAAIY